jgi:hypothetical protein
MSNLFTAVSAEQQEILAGGTKKSKKMSAFLDSNYEFLKKGEKLGIEDLDFKNGRNGSSLRFDELEVVSADRWIDSDLETGVEYVYGG